MSAGGTEQRRLSAIMFTDMVGYSALVERNEALALELLEEHRSLLRSIFPRFDGAEIKTIGDAFLVEFSSALEAAQCAIEIQRTLAKRDADAPTERQIQVRIGIHIGDVVHRENDVYGDGVNIASRIEALAGPSGICISMDVERQIRHALEASLVKLPPASLKNIQVPMDLFRIVLPWQKDEPGGTQPGTAPEAGPRNLRIAAVSVLVILLAVACGWLVNRFGARPGTRSAIGMPPAKVASSAQQTNSLAVLPFSNMSADKSDEYLCDGISEEIITSLSKLKGLKVAARTSSFAFKEKNEDIRRIGEQLGVRTVLEGSVTRAGNRLRVTAQLINIADGFHLWSETYDRSIDDLLAIRAEVATRVAEALQGHLLGEERQRLTRRGTDNAEAHRLYLEGRYLWNRRSLEALQKAVPCFDQAIGKDSSYALAYSGLADCYVVLPEYAGLPRRETVPKIRAAALRALELDPDLAEPHAALAFALAIGDWKWSEAEVEFRQAIALNPNYATAHHWLAVAVLSPLRRHEEALAEMQRARELDPLSPVINVNVGEYLGLAGQADAGIKVLQQFVLIDPSFPLGHRSLGRVYWYAGRQVEAVAELEAMHRLNPSGTYGLEGLGFVYARSGRTNEAQVLLRQMQEHRRQGFDCSVALAMVEHGLGDDAQALDLLETGFRENAFGMERLSYDPLLKDLRPHPRFQTILKKMNLAK